MFGKQGWCLLTNPSSLVARVFQAMYYPLRTFLDVELGSNPSYAWRSVFEAQDVVKIGARYRVGSELLEDLFVLRDVELIRSIPLPLTPEVDTLFWDFDAYGGYSVKSVYRAL
uniref:Uncharacterized protein n=1 Tax=Cannabis sativa TaxID=3483 RepID=A0A803QSK3_CANSA